MALTIDPIPSSAVDRELIVHQAVRQLDKLNLPGPARRLQSLNETLNDEMQMRRLANVNIYGAFDPAEIEKRASDEALRQNSSVWSGFEWIRNVLVLVPITITWFSFWQAAQEYAALLKVRPDLSGESFLYLWETKFAGTAGSLSPSFSQTALLVAFVLMVIIILTILVHFRKDVATTRAMNDAARIRSDVEAALWEIEMVLSGKRRADTEAAVADELSQAVRQFNQNSERMTKAVVQMDGGTREWMDLTKALDLRLGMVVNEMKDEADGLRVFSNGLVGNVDRMFWHLESANQTSTQLASAVERLSGAIQSNTVVQEDKLSDIAAQLTLMEEQARGWGQALRKTTDDLRLAVDRSSSSVAGAAGAVASVTALLKGQDEFRSSLKAFEQTLNSSMVSSRNDGIAPLMGQLKSSVDALTRANSEIATEHANLLTQIRNEIGQMTRSVIAQQTGVAPPVDAQGRVVVGRGQRGVVPLAAEVKMVPLAFAIGVSVVLSSFLVVGALYLMLNAFRP